MSNSALGRYDDLGEYAGRDVVVVVPRPASVYTLAAIAVVNTITGQVQYSTVQYSTVQYSTVHHHRPGAGPRHPAPPRGARVTPSPAQPRPEHPVVAGQHPALQVYLLSTIST